MKVKQPLRRFGVDDITAPDLSVIASNKTPISKKSGHVSLICPICQTSFTRKAAEAKRHAVSYCSRACAGVACRRQVEVRCVSCDKPFFVKQSHVGHITCCGEECRRKAISQHTTKENIAGWSNGRYSGSSHAKLTEDQAVAILADTRKHGEIADEYGISRSAVSAMKRGESWAHLKKTTE